jgi:hypothetical protein
MIFAAKLSASFTLSIRLPGKNGVNAAIFSLESFLHRMKCMSMVASVAANQGFLSMRMNIIAATAFLALASTAANAVVVTGLYNTGLGVGGAALAPGDGQQDANYTLTASTLTGVNPGDPTFTYFNGAYAAENAGSRWISYSGSPFAGVGGFTVSTTFDLTGYVPGSAAISGNWGVDNDGEIFLNGVTTGITLSGSSTLNFNVLHAFNITSGFIAGVNTLSFVNFDAGSPAAVRLDNAVLTANAIDGVPEAATWVMLIAGFGLTGAVMRRRRTAIAA